jgi:diguanylate cyclase (GGDEF)-like protein
MKNGNWPILVVDDEESLREVLAQVLNEEGNRVITAASGEEALDLFKKAPFPLVFTDIVMGGMSGIALLQEIKAMEPDTQVVIITSHASLDTALTALRSGAYDYLLKPFEDLKLISSVAQRALEKVNLIRENRRLNEELEKKNSELQLANKTLKDLASRDGLTGLFNHRHFQEALAMEISRSARHKLTFSLVFIDVDHFKNYNDTQGHPEGDRLLCALAQHVQERLRKSDLIARYGGEEFVIILSGTPKEEALTVANGICSMVANTPFSGSQSQPLGALTISMGIASYPEDGTDGSTLLELADNALYQAKKGGRNRVCAITSS